MRLACFGLAAGLAACATPDFFMPQSQYPPDPYVYGYTDPQDCLGGEDLAPIALDLPIYPKRAFRTGRQGWVILKLDIAEDGHVEDADVERSLPDGVFDGSATRAAEAWRFEPPAGGALQDCRLLVRYRLGEVTLGG